MRARDSTRSSSAARPASRAGDALLGQEGPRHRRGQGHRRRHRAASGHGGRACNRREPHARARAGARRRVRRRGCAPRRRRHRGGPPRRDDRRQARHPHQQRGLRRPLRLLHRHRPGSLAGAHRRQPRGDAGLHARRPATDAGGRLRAHRQHRLRGGAHRVVRERRLLGHEGRGHGVHQVDRPRERALRDHRKRARGRPDRDTAAREGAQHAREGRGDGRGDEADDAPAPARLPGGGGGGRRLPRLRGGLLHHG